RRLTAVIAGAPTITGLRTQPLHPHQASHAVPATGLAQLTQVVVDLAVAVDSAAFQPGMLDQSEQALIFLLACGFRLGQPGVVTAGMYLEGLAETPYRVLHRQLADDGVLQPDSLAKYAAAFFRMSRSSVTRLSSARKRRSSAC